MMKTCLLTVATLAFGTSTILAQEAAGPWQQDDGAIVFEGKVYKSWRGLHAAGVFGSRYRCGTSEPNPNAGIGEQFAGPQLRNGSERNRHPQ